MGDKPGEEGSADCAGGAADTDDGADACGGKHIGWGGEEVCGPALVGGGGEAEESDGGPCVGGEEDVHVRDKHDRHDAQSAEQHGEFSSGVDAVTALHEEAGEPAASDGAEAGCSVDHDERVFDVAEIEAVVVVEELGEIEEIEPPDGIGESLAEAERIEAAMAE